MRTPGCVPHSKPQSTMAEGPQRKPVCVSWEVWLLRSWLSHKYTKDSTQITRPRTRCHVGIESNHDDVIKWKHFPRYWPFVREVTGHRWIPRTKASDAELWCFLKIYALINGWVNNREAGDLRRHVAHYDVTVVWTVWSCKGSLHLKLPEIEYEVGDRVCVSYRWVSARKT